MIKNFILFIRIYEKIKNYFKKYLLFKKLSKKKFKKLKI